MTGSLVFAQRRTVLSTFLLAILFLLFVAHPVWAQGGPPVSGLDLTPSNPLGMPGTTGGLPRGSDTLNLSTRMFPEILPAIPGLEISYLHSFGRGYDSSRLLVEFVRPFRIDSTTTVYGEAHGLLRDFWRRDLRSEEGRLDLGLGGGVRKQLGPNTIVGAHAFYDARYEVEQWRSSASAGAMMAAILPGNDAIDLTVNLYSAYNSDPLIGLFEGTAKGSIDVTATYYHELWNAGPDVRLSAFGYSEDESVTTVHVRDRGYGGRVALASRDGMLRASYQYEHDSSLREIHTVGVNVNVGFRLENLLALESPIENPTPIFSSPRNPDRWTNVSEGTSRHVRKPLASGHSCSEDKAQACIYALQNRFDGLGGYITLGDWRNRIHTNLPSSCEACAADIHFSREWFQTGSYGCHRDPPYPSYVYCMNISQWCWLTFIRVGGGHHDPCCCSIWNY